MEYITGNKKIFLDFLNSIGEKDKVAVLTHTDLDGVASAVLIEEILKHKRIEISRINFIDYKKGMFGEILKKNPDKITKIFVLDISIDSDYEGFRELSKKFDVFLIDHHPSEIKELKNAIKTKTQNCAAFTIYETANEDFNLKEWNELVCATMISEFSYKDENNFQFIKKIYPEITPENIGSSIPGEESKKISSALIYFKGEEKKVFDLILNRDTKKLSKYYEIIEREIRKCVKKFMEEAEFFPEKNLYFYYYTPKFNITSIVTTILSLEKKDRTFIFVSDIEDEKGFIKVSSRNQSGNEDLNLLMKKGINGLENAIAGGHVRASGARFMKNDIKKFKKNILNC